MNQKARRAVSVADAADAFIRLERNSVAISKALGVSTRTLYRIINRPDFHTALDRRGYTGERSFRRQPHRPRTQGAKPRHHPQRDQAIQRYQALTHIPERNRTLVIAEELGEPYHTVRKWIKTYRDSRPKKRANMV